MLHLRTPLRRPQRTASASPPCHSRAMAPSCASPAHTPFDGVRHCEPPCVDHEVTRAVPKTQVVGREASLVYADLCRSADQTECVAEMHQITTVSRVHETVIDVRGAARRLAPEAHRVMPSDTGMCHSYLRGRRLHATTSKQGI
eukprot:2169515-Prymnesium_polylepis.3